MAVAFAPMIAGAATAADIQAQINSLMATIQSLQAQLSAATGSTATTGTCYTFNTNLTVGSKGTDVMNLQKVLNQSAATQVAATGAGSPGMETSTFGPMTKAAVMKFQTANGISPVAGYVGAITRAKLNAMCGTTNTTTTTTTDYRYATTTANMPTGGNLTVMAGVQPMNSLAPQSANRVPFTTVTLTAGASDVTVNSITVQRSGLAQDAVFAGIVLVDPTGMQVGIAKTLNSNHQAVIGNPFVIKAGTSETFTVAGNMASSLTNYAGQVASLNVVAVNTSATVAGSLPITGAQQTINASLTLGSATINTSSFDPNNGASEPIGTTGYRFSGFKVTAGSAEDLTLKSISWNQTGSVGSGDLANVVTVVNGTSYPTVVDATGKYYSTVFPGGIVITKGNSVDMYIQGDIVGSNSSGRTAEFDVYKNTDLYLVGNTYGYGITAPVGTGVVLTLANHATVINTSSNPWFEGSQASITAGSVTLIGKANEVASQNLAVNVPNQVLGGFATNFAGEPVSIQSMYFVVATSSTIGNVASALSPASQITSVSLVDQNGAVVAGPVDVAVGDGSTTHAGVVPSTTSYAVIHFTDTVTFPVGRYVYTLKGKLPSGWANGTTVNVFTEPYTDWTNVTGQSTGNTVSLSGQTTVISMNQMTVRAATLAVNISAQPAAQSVVGGAQNFVLANYQLDASQSGEDLRLSSFPVTVTAGNSSIGDLTGCTLNNGQTQLNTGSNVVNSLTSGTYHTFSFDNSLTVPKGTIVTLALECNIASSPTTNATYYATNDTNTAHYTVTGITSGNSVTPTFGTANGGLMTASTGSLSASIDSSSPGYALAAGGTTGQIMSVIKLRATNESVNLNKIGLVLTSTAAGNSSNVAGDLSQVYLYQGSTLLGTATFASGGTIATSTLSSPLVLQNNIDTLITVKADLADIGTNQSGTEGDLIKIDLSSTEGSGASSGSTIRTGAATGSAGVRVFNTIPTFTLGTLSSTGIADGHLMRFAITADSHGDAGLYKFTFTLATTTITVRDVGLFGYTDSGYSTAMSGNFAKGGTSNGGQIDENLATSSASNICTGSGSDTVNTTNAGSTCASDSSKTTLTFRTASNPVEVPAGQTRYFELRGSVTGISGTYGGSVVTKMLADTAAATSTATGVGAGTTYNFVWSPNATSTSVFSSNDWTTGYGIVGLPSSGLLWTRSN